MGTKKYACTLYIPLYPEPERIIKLLKKRKILNGSNPILNIKSEMHNVAVTYHIFFAFNGHFSGLFTG